MIPGDYIFEWSISNGSCTTTMDDMQVSIYQFPPVVNAGADQNLCNVNTVSLSGNSPSAGSGTWSFISGPNSPTISAPTSPSTNVSGVVAGTYLFAWNIVNGVCAVYGDTVQVTIDALPTISNAGTDGSFCNVNSVTLNGVFAASGNGLWNQINGPNSSTIVSPNSGTSTVNGLIAGTYQFTWTISNGICSASTDTVQFSIYDLPLTVDAGSDQSLCNSNSVTMGGNVPTTGTGSWTLITGPNNPAIVSVNNPSTLITGLIPGNYIFGWTINNGLCSTITDSVSITNDGTPTVALAGTDQTRCNDTSTTLNGNTPVTGSGTWTQVSGPNAATIFSQTDPFTLIENLVPGVYSFVWTIDNGVCASSNDTVKITINSLANIANAGADQSLCNQSSVTMFANSAGVGTGNWTLISGPNVPVIVNSVDENTDVIGMIAGTYIFRWTITNSICTSTFDDVQVVILDSPAITSAGIDQFLCNTNSTTLAANLPTIGTGTWTLITGPNLPIFTLPNNENSTVTGMTEGIYQFGWMISNGNCASGMDTVQIANYNLPSVADAGIDQNICANSILTLNGNNPSSGSGMWTQISGPNSTFINSPSSPVTIDSAFIAGAYTFTWAISNGVCATSTDTVQITILDLPNVAFAGNDQRLCNANLISIAGNNPINGVGVWTLVSGPNVPTILSPDSTMTDVIGTIPGNYIFRWSISNSSCSSTNDDVLITIDSVPTGVNAGLDQSWCSLNTVQLQGNIPVVGSGSWIFISGPNVPTIDFPLSENSTVSSLVQGSYEFRWTVINGTCENFDEVQIVLNAPPVVTVTQNLFTTCEGVRTATLEASGAFTYLWSPSTNLSNSSISNPTLTIDQALIYTVIGTDVNGCSASDTVTIEICDTINIPSGFSPDGDGINDNFEIVGIENYPDNVLRVFNRWGNLLYEKKKYNNSWNGIPNVNSLIIGNGKVTSGTYFYILELGAYDKTKTGYIIIRY